MRRKVTGRLLGLIVSGLGGEGHLAFESRGRLTVLANAVSTLRRERVAHLSGVMAKSLCFFGVVAIVSLRGVSIAVGAGCRAPPRGLRPATGRLAAASGRAGPAALMSGPRVAVVSESLRVPSRGPPGRSEASPVTERGRVVEHASATPMKGKREGQVADKKGRALKKASTSRRGRICCGEIVVTGKQGRIRTRNSSLVQ